MADRFRIGVDVGGTKCLAVALDDQGGMVAERKIPTPAPPALLDGVAALVEQVRREVGAGGPVPVEMVGVGAPGLVDRQGVLRYAPNLSGLTRLELRAGLEERVGLPVRAENDATCAAWGEHQLGAARGLSDVVLATLGTGIGGGIVTRGMLNRGAHGFAGEIGHMVVDPQGPPCACGQRGCWERLASGSALGRMGREAASANRAPRLVELAEGDPEAVRGEHVSVAAAEGDPPALSIMAEFAWWVARGLANLANVFDPEAFVLGGGLVRAGPTLFEPTRAAFADLVLAAAHRPAVRILPAVLGERAGAIGAALLPPQEEADQEKGARLPPLAR